MADYSPTFPEYDRVASLVTYQDAVERLLIQYDRKDQGRDAMLARQAIDEALRRLSNHPWKYYTATYQLDTDASYETGTIAYTHSTKAVTLTDGTWPTNAAYGTVLIDNVAYPVASRDSDSQITLRNDRNPGADVASGTSYKWYRDAYALSPDFESMCDPMDTEYKTGGPDLIRVNSEMLASLDRVVGAKPVTYPQYYAIERDPRFGKVIRIAPPPSDARTYNFVYRRTPRKLNVALYTDGTVSVSGTAVTGTDTAWSSSHVGCVFRVGTAKDVPTGPIGGLADDGTVSYSPPQYERIVTSVTDATHLVLDSSGTTVSSVKYSLSDPIDIDWTVCGEYFNRLCEHMFTTVDMDIGSQLRDTKVRLARQAYHMAADRDRMRDSVPTGYPWWWVDFSAFAGEWNADSNDYQT